MSWNCIFHLVKLSDEILQNEKDLNYKPSCWWDKIPFEEIIVTAETMWDANDYMVNTYGNDIHNTWTLKEMVRKEQL